MKPQDVLQNLKFLRTCLIAKLKEEEVPESESRINAILRSTLSDIKVISRKYNTPELTVLADNIYTNLVPRPERKLRKKIFFILGAIFNVGIAFIGGDFDLGEEDSSEEKQKLKHAFLQIESVIKIVNNIIEQ